MEVRYLSQRVEAITRRSVTAQCLRRLQQWKRASSMLAASASVQVGGWVGGWVHAVSVLLDYAGGMQATAIINAWRLIACL